MAAGGTVERLLRVDESVKAFKADKADNSTCLLLPIGRSKMSQDVGLSFSVGQSVTKTW